MAISEQLQNRIASLTGGAGVAAGGAGVMRPMDMIGQPKGAISNREMEIYNQATGGMGPVGMIGQASRGAISNQDREIADMMMRPGEQMPPQDMMMRNNDPMGEAQLMQEMQGMSEEDQLSLQNMLEQGQIKTDAPLNENC